MSKITITKGDTTIIAPHFTAGEFHSKRPNAPASHDFYSECVEAVAYLRSHYGVPWRVTSTYRPDSVGSQHRECRAVDSQDTQSGAGHGSPVMLDLVAQILNPKSEVFTQLRRLGITGFGVYDTFVHLDCRDTTKFPAAHRDKLGAYALWDERSDAYKAAAELKKKAPQTTSPALAPSSAKNSNPPKAPAPALMPSSGKSLAPRS